MIFSYYCAINRSSLRDYKQIVPPGLSKKGEEERKKEKKEWNQRWGDLANKMGTIVEDIVAPNIPRIG